MMLFQGEVTQVDQVGEPGFGFSVRWRIPKDKNSAEIEVFEQSGIEDDGAIVYEAKNATDSGDVLNDLNAAQPMLTAWIRFDGCSHLTFDDSCALHVCGARGWARLAELIAWLPKRAQELAPGVQL